MEFEWDEAKRQKVLIERGLDFLELTALFDGRQAYSYISQRGDEQRIVTVAELKGKLCAVVWVEREERVRIITGRRARHGEERAYRQSHDG